MVHGKNKALQYRRKRLGLTNYGSRLGLLKSGKPRMVIRKSSRYLMLQLVEYLPDGDKVLVSVSSKSLSTLGWKFSYKNLPAAYLSGLLFGKKAMEKSKAAIVDIGSLTSKKEGVLYAAVKGAIDAGMDIPVSEEILPGEDRISGKHIVEFGKKLDKEKYNKLFSGYNKEKLSVDKLPEEFEKVKAKIK